MQARQLLFSATFLLFLLGSSSTSTNSSTRSNNAVVIRCQDETDCTPEVQVAFDNAAYHHVLFPEPKEYVITPTVLRANHTILTFAPGSSLVAKKGAFIGGVRCSVTKFAA
jgi:hypothetical protein